MRIAFISTILGYPWGGADTLWTRAAEAACERGDQLLISVSTDVAGHPRISSLIKSGAEVVVRDSPKTQPTFGSRLLSKLAPARTTDAELISCLQRFRPDLVIISLGGTYDLIYHSQLITWLRSSRPKFRIIANWQQENPFLNATELALARDILTAADRVNFVSTRNLEATRRHLLHPLPNACVIQNPLRWQPTDISPWPTAPGWRLATVSRLDESKGIQLLLHTLAQVLKTDSSWQLNIYGQGPAENYLRATVEHLKLSDRVQFRGHVNELRAIWNENHLMISPSLEDGVPMTIPEAMLCQRPVLATRVGGAEDWLKHGESGFLCPAPVVNILADSLLEAFAARDRWEAMGHAAAEAATRRYRADDYLQLIAG